MDFPITRVPPPPILTPFSVESIGYHAAGQLIGLGASGIGTAAWPTANLAIFVPFELHDWATAYQLLWWVGATSAGNIDVGIYDSQMNRIVSSGSTAMSATVSTVQELNIADTVLPPGNYLLAGACSLSTGTAYRWGLADEAMLANIPIYTQGTAFPLPATCVPVVPTIATVYLPVIGIQFVPVF